MCQILPFRWKEPNPNCPSVNELYLTDDARQREGARRAAVRIVRVAHATRPSPW